jgi:hypothetical protein
MIDLLELNFAEHQRLLGTKGEEHLKERLEYLPYPPLQ